MVVELESTQSERGQRRSFCAGVTLAQHAQRPALLAGVAPVAGEIREQAEFVDRCALAFRLEMEDDVSGDL